MSLLAIYILNPKKALQFFIHRLSYKTAWAILACVSLLFSVLETTSSFSFFLLSFFSTFICLAIVLIIFSLLIDFGAQLLGHRGQSLLLFYWLLISLTPLLCIGPVYIILGLTLNWAMVYYYCWLVLLSLIIWLQITSISRLYVISSRRALLLYLFPFFSFIITLLFLIGVTSLFFWSL